VPGAHDVFPICALRCPFCGGVVTQNPQVWSHWPRMLHCVPRQKSALHERRPTSCWQFARASEQVSAATAVVPTPSVHSAGHCPAAMSGRIAVRISAEGRVLHLDAKLRKIPATPSSRPSVASKIMSSISSQSSNSGISTAPHVGLHATGTPPGQVVAAAEPLAVPAAAQHAVLRVAMRP
jgi:hypothetical protein